MGSRVNRILEKLFLALGASLQLCLGSVSDDIIRELLPMADIYENRACYRKALELYERILENYPDATLIPLVKFRLAKNYQLQGKYEEAFRRYKELSQTLPTDVSSALLTMGADLMTLKRYNEAVEVYSFFRETYPTNEAIPFVLFNLAQCKVYIYLDKGGKKLLDEAIDHLETLIINFPSHYLIPSAFDELRYIWQISYME
ncbi:tetratricopeptide repeat protein [bacterium]|nr:tetratricopeptide repeat protein [bacterium]